MYVIEHMYVDTYITLICMYVCNSYSALSVRYGSNTARGPSAVFEAISYVHVL